MGETVAFEGNGGTASGYLARPAAGAGPGVIVVQEWWGLTSQIKGVCDRLAAEGFSALVPDLYHGVLVEHAEPDEAGRRMLAMDLERVAKEMSGAIDYLASQPVVRGEGVGVVGFCMGGGLALVLACQRPDQVKAVVSYYGVIPWEGVQPDYSKLQAAVQGHYAENDTFASPQHVRALNAQLRGLGKDVQFFIYPNTTHAFANDQRPDVYNEEAARQAWVRTLEFLRAKLG